MNPDTTNIHRNLPHRNPLLRRLLQTSLTIVDKGSSTRRQICFKKWSARTPRRTTLKGFNYTCCFHGCLIRKVCQDGLCHLGRFCKTVVHKFCGSKPFLTSWWIFKLEPGLSTLRGLKNALKRSILLSIYHLKDWRLAGSLERFSSCLASGFGLVGWEIVQICWFLCRFAGWLVLTVE